MKLLEGKKALIFGIANKNSIAWGVAKALHAQGADIAFSYAIPALEKRVYPLAKQLGVTFVEKCDVSSDEEIDATFAKVADYFDGEFDILIHAIGYAQRDDLKGRYVDTNREGFKIALEISAYSLVALAQRAAPLMPNGGSIVTMTYYGAEKVIPHYNVMGVAKAALEVSTRYLAYDLGCDNIRVNAVSAGPIKTLAAAGISGFRKMLTYVADRAPLQRNIDQDEVGQTTLWLCSDLSSGVTGETIYVDAGYNIMGMDRPPNL